MPIIRRSDCVQLAYSCLSCCSCSDAGESGRKMCALCGECVRFWTVMELWATFSTQCTHLATRLSSITTATRGQTTIGSGTQSDLLMMGIKMPKHVEILLITNKSLFVASSWFLLYLLIKDARSFEHKNKKSFYYLGSNSLLLKQNIT